MYNPDYPTDQTGGFLQHTYQQQPANTSFYWNGGYGSAPGFGMDSRRNLVNPVNPFNTFGHVGMGQAPSTDIPESAVQPFGTYPPSTPQQNMGLNAMIDSRRSLGNQNAMPQNNPWAPQQPTPQTQAVFGAVPSQPVFQQPTCDPYAGFGGNCYIPNDPNTRALYADFGYNFDRHNSWDNYYTSPRQIQPPTIDWRAASNPQASMANQWQNAGFGMQPSFFGQNPNTAGSNWNEIQAQNWNVKR